MDKWEKKHRTNVEGYARQIDAIYQSAVRDAAAIGAVITDFNPDKAFSFADYPNTRKRIDKLLNELKSGVNTTILNGVDSEWTLANDKNNELCNVVFGKNAKKLSAEQERRYYRSNGKACDAFKARKTAGLGLSDFVWKYTDQFKSEIEMGLDLGLRDGLSADEISRELRSYLKYPDKLFRRVRDTHGQLHLSQAAKAFHPGQGVYRSSYKNARRLAATETNMAYRTSDYVRYQQLDFVVGIEVHTSNNHPEADICDSLAGKYPKDFKFTGWHPQCRCYTTSILKTEKEMQADTDRIMRGEELTGESVNKVDDVPPQFKQWTANNEKRLTTAKSMPYFVRDNEKYFPQMCITNTAAKGVKEAQRLNDKLAQAAKESIDYDKINDAMEQYVGGDGMWINQYLRDKSGFGELDGAEMEYLKELTDITSIENVGERVLYRSVDARAIFGNMTDIDFENLQSYYLYEGRDRYALAQADRASKLIGTERIEKGFMSTTKSFDIAAYWSDYTGADYPVMMRIKTGANTKGFDVERYTKIHNPEIEIDSPQREMLLARGQKYKITNISKEGRNICVDVEIIDTKAAASAPKLSPLDIAKQRHAARTPEQEQAIQQAWDASRQEAHRQAILDAAKLRQAARTPEQIKAIQKAWGENRFKQTINSNFVELFENLPQNGKVEILTTNQSGVNGSTNRRGIIRLTQDRFDNCTSAISKVRSGKLSDLTDKEGDALGTLWHEITHNRHVGLDRSGSLNSKSRAYMELANELTARKTLPEFYSRLGVKFDELPDYIKTFMNYREGTGYNRMVTNYDYVIKRLNLNSNKVLSDVRNHLFNAEYNNQITGLKNALVNGGLKYTNGNMVKASDLNELMRLINEISDEKIHGKMRTKEELIEIWLKLKKILPM